jgi:hypothetical protein
VVTFHLFTMQSRQGLPLLVVLQDREGDAIELFAVPAYKGEEELMADVLGSFFSAGGGDVVREVPRTLDIDTLEFTPEWFEREKIRVIAELATAPAGEPLPEDEL